MAKKTAAAVKPVEQHEPDLELLAKIAEATRANSFLYVNATDLEPLLAFGYVEVNRDMVNPADSNAFATRATAAGTGHVTPEPAPTQGVQAPAWAQTAPVAPADAPKARAPRASMEGMLFNLAFVAPIQALTRGPKKSVYPFDDMAPPQRDAHGAVVGMQSFFVPSTADREFPAKSLASTVSSASKRWKKKNEAGHGPVRKFSVQAVSDGGQWGHPGVAGAAIYRVE